MTKSSQTKQQKATSSVSILETIMVPLGQLVPDPDNVRKTDSDTGIEILADNIQAEGLLQNLIVRALDKQQFAVSGGERRRQALLVLVERGQMTLSDKVPCQLIARDVVSASVSENSHRVAMNPADQYVAQRLTLGRLSPVLLDALRTGQMALAAAHAYTLTDDHKRQESVFDALSKQHGSAQDAHHIRRMLTDNALPNSDKLAKFVGREVYAAAGGRLHTDLFEETVYFQSDLLTKLAMERLEKEAEPLKSAGWKWVDMAIDMDYSAGSRMNRIYPHSVMNEAQQAEKDALLERIKAMDKLDDSDELDKEYEAIEQQLDELEESSQVYDAIEQANAGGFLSINHDGSLCWRGGYVRTEDSVQAVSSCDAETDAETQIKSSGTLTKSLRSDLSALRLAMMQTECLKHPALARDLMLFHMLRGVLPSRGGRSAFAIHACKPHGEDTHLSAGDMGSYSGRESLDQLVKALPLSWLDHDDIVTSFDAFIALRETEKTALQAYMAALTLKPQLSDDHDADIALEHTLGLMDANLASYWTPNADFFNRLTKDQLCAIGKQVISEQFEQSHMKDKKALLAEALSVTFNANQEDSGFSDEVHQRIAVWLPDCLQIRW